MNRILQWVHPHTCQFCQSLHEIERKLDLAEVAAERIEIAAGDGVLEFWIPDASRVLKAPDNDEPVGIRMMLAVEPRLATIDEDLAQYAVAELRRLARELTSAADAVEIGGVV